MRNLKSLAIAAITITLLFLAITMSLQSFFLLASSSAISTTLSYHIPPALPPRTLYINLNNPTNNQPSSSRPNPSFKISIFQDLHYGEAESTPWGPHQDTKTTSTISNLLSLESPDLVVLNGDLITGENTFLENSTDYLEQILGPMVQRGVKWASCYGNHDSDFKLSREAVFKREKEVGGGLSLTGRMVREEGAGWSNYYVPVVFGSGGDDGGSGDDDGDRAQRSTPPDFLLWFFDSRGGNKFQQTDKDGNTIPLENWVDQSVVDWFRETSIGLEKKWGRVVPSFAFVHIPLSAMLVLQEKGVDKNREPGVNDDVPLAAQGQGWGYKGQDVPFMQALVDTKGLQAVFTAHDHGNTYCQKWTSTTTIPGTNLSGNGLNLCFGQHTGYGGYGSWIRGSRQILIRPGSSDLETWMRLEDGSESGRVVLNDTYGQDMYEEVEDRRTHLI